MYDFFDYVCFTVATILMVVLIWLAVDMMTVARQADHDSQEVEYYRKTYDEFVVPRFNRELELANRMENPVDAKNQAVEKFFQDSKCIFLCICDLMEDIESNRVLQEALDVLDRISSTQMTVMHFASPETYEKLNASVQEEATRLTSVLTSVQEKIQNRTKKK